MHVWSPSDLIYYSFVLFIIIDWRWFSQYDHILYIYICVCLFITICFWSIYNVVFEACKWSVWFYLIWDGIPQGCAWKWETSFKRSILGLGRVMYLDVARMLEQIKSCLRYGGARFLYALNTNTNTALLNLTFSLSGSIPKYRSFV